MIYIINMNIYYIYFLYIHKYTHYVNQILFWMWLIVINRFDWPIIYVYCFLFIIIIIFYIDFF